MSQPKVKTGILSAVVTPCSSLLLQERGMSWVAVLSFNGMCIGMHFEPSAADAISHARGMWGLEPTVQDEAQHR